jgi:P4 family phage/plasmid primase-like protien
MSIDIQVAKEAARGHWSTIANRVIGIPDDYLTTKQGPCPKCKCGTDRWRVYNDFDETGGAMCNQCGKSADGFALAQWYLDCSLNEAIEKVCQFLGVEDSKAKKRKRVPARFVSTKPDSIEGSKPAKNLPITLRPWNDKHFGMCFANKKPITMEAVKLAGGTVAKHYGDTVMAFPCIGRDGQPSGWAMYNINGGPIKYRPSEDEPYQDLKIKLIGCQGGGWIGRINPNRTEDPIFKVEGVSDMLTILSANPEASVITNANGAGQDPLHKERQWMLEVFRDRIVYTIHDQDDQGQDGATWTGTDVRKRPGWAVAISLVAKESRNVNLPFPMNSKNENEKDVRDFFNDRLDKLDTMAEAFQELVKIAAEAPVIVHPDGYQLTHEDSSNFEEQDVEADEQEILNRHHIDDPHRLAEINLQLYQGEFKRHLVYWNQTWYRYKEGAYLEITTDHLVSRLTESIKREFDRAWKLELKAYKQWKRSKDYDPDEDNGPPKVRKVKSGLVNDVYVATRGKCTIESGQKMHDWIRERESHDGICIATENGILNITKAISNEDIPRDKILIPHTPNWFSTSKLQFNFDENAQCKTWCKFLDDVFNSDQQQIEALQRWFGYLLTPDNSLNKIMFVIGEPRSGKGTIVQIMKELFGESNVATPKLTDLSKDFALQPLSNKTVAIIPDARLSRRADETMITETLLSISGGDPQDVARKFKDTLSGYQMKCRFTIFSNLVPNLKDLSSAFITRCIFLHMPNSYLGREDFELKDKLKRELSGILNWAIMGRHMLNESKRIVQPNKGTKFIDELKSLTSPILEFIESECEVGSDGFEIDTKDFFRLWESWCEENDIEHPGTVQNFCRKVKAIRPGINTKDYRVSQTTKGRKMIGIRIKENKSDDY